MGGRRRLLCPCRVRQGHNTVHEAFWPNMPMSPLSASKRALLAECVYVLAGVYHVPRSRIAESLGILLDEVTCRRRNVAAAALGLYSGSSFDFVDCVLAAERQELGRDVMTFDKKLIGLLGKVE